MAKKINKDDDRIAKFEIDISKCYSIRLVRTLCSISKYDKGINYTGPSLETLERMVKEQDDIREKKFQAFAEKWRIDHPAPVTKSESTLISPVINILNLPKQLGEQLQVKK